MKIAITVDNDYSRAVLNLTSELDLLQEDIHLLKTSLADVFRCGENQIIINIIEL
jgi:hypothetical protein